MNRVQTESGLTFLAHEQYYTWFVQRDALVIHVRKALNDLSNPSFGKSVVNGGNVHSKWNGLERFPERSSLGRLIPFVQEGVGGRVRP